MAFWDQFIGPAIESAGDYFGSQAQIGGLQEAGATLSSEAKRNRRLQAEMLAIVRQLFGEGADLRGVQREASEQGLRGLMERATAQPGTSLSFNRALAGGTRALTRNLAQYGINPESGAFGRASGELAGSLTAADQDQITQIMQFLSGQAPNVLQYAPSFAGVAQNYGQTSSGLQQGVAQTKSDIGGVRGALYSSIGERFAQPFNQQSQQSNEMALLQKLKDSGLLAMLTGG